MPSSETLERTKFELAKLNKMLAKQFKIDCQLLLKSVGLDGKNEAATTTAINGGDPYIGYLKDALAELIRQRDVLAGNG